jgi:hypothetical protein
MYGFTLFLSTLSHIVCFVSDVYNAIHLLIIPYSNKKGVVSKVDVVLFSVSSLITAVSLILLTLPCQKMCEDHQRCVDNVQELLLRSDQKHITLQLKLMANQLENNRIEFTAYGFFPVNFSLLTAVTGVTVTYIILLIQVY